MLLVTLLSRHKTWHLSLLFLIVATCPMLGHAEENPVEAEQKARVEVWIRDLGNPSARRRQQATAALIELGPSSTSRVTEAVASGDFEVSVRALHILASQFQSEDRATRRAARGAFAQLSKSKNESVARRSANAFATLIALPRAAAIAKLQELGAEVQIHGDLGSRKTPVEVTIGENWVGSSEDLEILHDIHNLQTLVMNTYYGGDEHLLPLKGLTALRSLTIYSLDPTEQGVALLSELTQLRSLDLSSSLIDDEDIRRLKTLANLEELILRDTLVSGDSIQHIEAFPKLKSLSLAMTRLTSDEFQQLAAIEQLEQIEVSRTQFSGESLQALRNLKNLRSVTASFARVSTYDVEDFSEIRGNVQVEIQ